MRRVRQSSVVARDFRVAALLLAATIAQSQVAPSINGPQESGVTYTNHQIPGVPWSIHVVRVDRSGNRYQLLSSHAEGIALGLERLSDQVRRVDPALGIVAAAVNGDFYQRDREFAGDPRGLQIINGEVISAPSGGACFWVDLLGEPHVDTVSSLFQIVWPDGSTNHFGLNEDTRSGEPVLYTPSLGPSTRTMGLTELILERNGKESWLPLKLGRPYRARVREVRRDGDSRLEPGTAVLAVSPSLAERLANVTTGSILTLSMATSPDLRGAKAAIGGGPVLLRNGVRQKHSTPSIDSYVFSSMNERHPRTAIGWNRNYYFLVEVDGRQRTLSAGMTVDELSTYLLKLGCEDAMNLDGGGSATLWWNGQVRNSPCDGHERPIANSLIVVDKGKATGQSSSTTANQPN